MSIRIKNCGLSTPETIDQAIATGARFLGFVHHAASPRHVEIAQMKSLIAHAAKRAKTVAVLVNPGNGLIDEVIAAGPDYLQLHEVHSAVRINDIAERAGKPIITAISVRSATDLTFAAALEEISAHLLFDARAPGSGKTFDWQLLKQHAFSKPWFLAGGLTVENVAEAIRATQAPMVDVSSGIESSPGMKSLEKIAAFNAAVLAS